MNEMGGACGKYGCDRDVHVYGILMGEPAGKRKL
jgi:hypothetical protein